MLSSASIFIIFYCMSIVVTGNDSDILHSIQVRLSKIESDVNTLKYKSDSIEENMVGNINLINATMEKIENKIENEIEMKLEMILNKNNDGNDNENFTKKEFPTHCGEAIGSTDKNGIYTLWSPDDSSQGRERKQFQAYCMKDPAGMGKAWTIIQRRRDGSVDFLRKWQDYKNGFGQLDNGEFWLGLENIHEMTSTQNFELFIRMTDWHNQHRFASYHRFAIGNETQQYTLYATHYHGNAGNALKAHNLQKFSTIDRDNDNAPERNCAEFAKGAWWYNRCHQSNLNGEYNNTEPAKGINWAVWHGKNYSLKSVVMAIRPKLKKFYIIGDDFQ